MYTVLIVDDEPLVLEGLRFIVDWESYGFQVCGEASDGEEALAMMQQTNPDLVVTDISMPVMNGLEFIQQAKQVLNTKAQFFVLSGHNDFSYAREALTYGVINYWLKPIDIVEIHTSLEKLSAQWIARDKVEQQKNFNNQLCGVNWAKSSLVELLFEAEDRLLMATASGDKKGIDEAIALLYQQLELSFANDNEGKRAFISNTLLELSWKLYENENAFVDEDGKYVVALPHLTYDILHSLEILTTFAYEVREKLLKQRQEHGSAWKAARLIREQYNQPLQLQHIAKTLNLQSAYLGQLFKKQYGMSFVDYVHRTRIEEARKLIRRKDMKIADIAREVGYSDAELFSTKFKQWMNMTPSQYKNSQL